ncbi:NAD(P)-binding protein [Meredithblackwellia eburnea MCA 4105]
MAAAAKTLAIILGAGPGTGQALGQAFAKKHSVALLARSAGSLDKVTESITSQGGDAAPFACDASSEASLKEAFKAIRDKFPEHQLKVACFNANAPFISKPFLELTQKDMTVGIDLNVMGAFNFSQLAIPLMLEHGNGGSLFFSGATAALKGSANFAAFSPSKFALRSMSQTLAREFHPKGIHVVHAIIDGFIDTPNLRKFMGEPKNEGDYIATSAIADTFVYLSEQDKSCWTQEIDLRPSVEKF